MPTTPKLGLTYPSGAVGVPPDVPGDIYKLAIGIDNAYSVTDLTSTVTLTSNVSFDSGLNQILKFGSLRVLNLSVVSSSPITGGNGIAFANVGNRPAAVVFGAALIIDSGVQIAGTAYLADNGTIGVSARVSDVGGDSAYTQLRCSFVYGAV